MENEYTKQLSDEELNKVLFYLLGIPFFADWETVPREIKIKCLMTCDPGYIYEDLPENVMV